MLCGPWRKRTSGVAHMPSERPVLSSHVTTFSIFQVLWKLIGVVCGERAVTMVVSEATQARSRKDKAPAVNTFAPPDVQDA